MEGANGDGLKVNGLPSIATERIVPAAFFKAFFHYTIRNQQPRSEV